MRLVPRIAVAGTVVSWSLVALAAIAIARQEPGGDSEAIAERIRTLEARLEELASERSSVVRAFEAADVELALRREQARMLTGRVEHLTSEREALAARVAALEGTVADALAALRVRARALYRVGPLAYNRLLLAADSAHDALVAYQLITFLTARDRDLARAVKSELDELAAARGRLVESETRLAQTRSEVAELAAQLEVQQQERRSLLRRIDLESEAQRVALVDAERAARELTSTIETLGESSETPIAGLVAARGALPWPVEGPVVGGFGRRHHPVYDTYTVSRGVEIGGTVGDPVRAVFAGRVAFADWYSGYGLLVILDHGAGYHTLYGHLSEIAVRAADRVELGDVVGRVGETASLTGPNLYFEIREGTDALDPLRWLAPRS